MKRLNPYKEMLESLCSDIGQIIEKLTLSGNEIPYNTEIKLDELSKRLPERNNFYLTLSHIPRGFSNTHVYKLRLYDSNIDSPIETVIIKYFPAKASEQTYDRRRPDEYGKKWHRYLKDITNT